MIKNKISVIMAVYNCADTVGKSIESIVNQTYRDWELIICDDCSTDNTYKIAKKYADKYKNKIILIKNEQNSKLPFTLNHCLKYATGEFIARMDGDDISLAERFEKQIIFLKEHPDIDLVGTGVQIFDGEKIVGSIIKQENVNKYDLLKAPCFSHATIMTYKYVYDKIGGYSLAPEAIRVEDVDLWCRFFAAGFRGANLQTVLYIVTEDINTMKRRVFKDRINGTKILLKGYKAMGFPARFNIYAYKSLLVGLLPKKIYIYLHRKKLDC